VAGTAVHALQLLLTGGRSCNVPWIGFNGADFAACIIIRQDVDLLFPAAVAID
jgi:hypothetical protein